MEQSELNPQQVSLQSWLPKITWIKHEELSASIASFGVQVPILILRSTEQPDVILDGWQRYQYAKQQNLSYLPTIILHRLAHSDLYWFELALDLNETRQFNLIEKALLLQQLGRLTDDEAIKERLAQKLGAKNWSLAKDYLKLLQLSQAWQAWLVQQNYSLTLGVKLANLSTEEQIGIFSRMAQLSFNQNKWIEVLDLFTVIRRRDQVSILKLWDELLEDLSDNSDKNQLTERFRARLKELRYPHFEQKRKWFEQEKTKLSIPQGTQVNAAPFFEDDYVEIKTRVRSLSDRKKLIELLQKPEWDKLV